MRLQAVWAGWLPVNEKPGLLVTSLSQMPPRPIPVWGVCLIAVASNTVLVGPRWAVGGPMEDQSILPTDCLSVFKGLSPLNPGILGDE